MIDAFVDTLELFPRGLVYVGLGLGILLLAKVFQDLATPYRINYQLAHKDNVALGLSITGYYLGVVAIFVGSVYQPITDVSQSTLGFDSQFGKDVLEVFLYSLVGVVALNVARLLLDRLVLYKFDTRKEIIDDQNIGTGAVEFGVYIAVGLVVAGSSAGAGGGPETSVAFFGLGILVLAIYTLFYEMTTSFDVHDEIEKDNAAVGIALGGNIVAMGLVTFKAVFGDFVGWQEGLAGFLTFAVIGFALLFVVRTLVDLLLLPTTKIAHELAVDRNVGVAFIESGVVVSAALILFFAI